MAGNPEALTSIELSPNIVVKNLYAVRKKLGEGCCGAVYLVECLKKPPKTMAAMKVEALMKHKDDEILKMEIYVLKRMQGSKHACRLVGCGKTEQFTYVVMSLLGKSLTELRRRQPKKTLSLGTSLHIGMQSLQAIEDLHKAGFIHRDIKPTNFACGAEDIATIYLFDFGLARQIFVSDKPGAKPTLRKPRAKVSFRGTVRYCSLNIHNHKEPGRHDDLWGLLFTLIELLTSSLPWKGRSRTESATIKARVVDSVLLEGCPQSFHSMIADLRKLTYYDAPNYEQMRGYFKKDMQKNKIALAHPFEWQKSSRDYNAKILKKQKEDDEKMEKDASPENDTRREIEETEPSIDSQQQSTGGYDTCNTLQNCPEAPKKGC
ncbi:CK1 protein kinase [Aphelenchoides avenae]|nr:CK1 protein kinase [Aphelenchus avenae]